MISGRFLFSVCKTCVMVDPIKQLERQRSLFNFFANVAAAMTTCCSRHPTGPSFVAWAAACVRGLQGKVRLPCARPFGNNVAGLKGYRDLLLYQFPSITFACPLMLTLGNICLE